MDYEFYCVFVTFRKVLILSNVDNSKNYNGIGEGLKEDYQTIWNNCIEYIRSRVPQQTLDTWFKPIKSLSVNEGNLFLQVPNRFFYDWIESHYSELVRSAVKETTGDGLAVRYTVLVSDERTADSELIKYPHGSTETAVKTGMFERGTKINERYTFENFIEGGCNQFARASGMAVANAVGRTSFNPLVIYGGTGLGKTHLLQAIGNEALCNGRASKVVYISSDMFTIDFITAIQKNRTAQFSKYYRSVDILLLDDIQFFQNKEQTQEQFFHIFNDLYQNHHQIVLTSDHQPNDLLGLRDRLISRFQSGLVVDIQPPDLETRIAIIQKKADQDQLDIPFEIIEYLATNICSNVRDLEGAMIRILAYSSLLRVDIDLKLAQKVLREILGSRHSTHISIEDVQSVVGSSYKVSLDLLVGKDRTKEVAEARMLAMYFAREYTNLSLRTIGLYFGGRDHSTVVHARNWVKEKIADDPIFSQRVSSIQCKIESSI